MIVLRSEVDIDNGYRDKISLFCDVDRDAAVIAKDVNILYEMVGIGKAESGSVYLPSF